MQINHTVIPCISPFPFIQKPYLKPFYPLLPVPLYADMFACCMCNSVSVQFIIATVVLPLAQPSLNSRNIKVLCVCVCRIL